LKEVKMERNALKTVVVLVLLAASARGYEWACRYDGPVHGPDCASAMTLSPDGVPCVAGSATASDSSEDWITLREFEGRYLYLCSVACQGRAERSAAKGDQVR
jgi:hypothetical protein